MASDATKSHIFQQLFSIKILTKLSYSLALLLSSTNTPKPQPPVVRETIPTIPTYTPTHPTPNTK